MNILIISCNFLLTLLITILNICKCICPVINKCIKMQILNVPNVIKYLYHIKYYVDNYYFNIIINIIVYIILFVQHILLMLFLSLINLKHFIKNTITYLNLLKKLIK